MLGADGTLLAVADGADSIGGDPERHEVAQRRLGPPVADWSPRAVDPAMQTELRTALSAAIDELPASYRAVLVLRDVEGRSNQEIAEALGLGIAVVKTRAHRARLFLRKRLGESMTTTEATTPSACA